MTEAYTDHVEHWIKQDPKTIILQPTSYCPMDCTYCYLPGRQNYCHMPPATARAVASAIECADWPNKTEIVWHGGEPLGAGTDRLNALLKQFESLRHAGRIQHIIQTGATLITDEWCSLFQRYGAGVGVSIDGPRFANTHRVNRAGRPMFDQIVAGAETLRRNGLPFTVLAVITQDTIEHAEDILNFVHDELGCSWVGLNIEAQEAANVNGQPPTIGQARRFWRDVFAWSREHPGKHVREADRILGFLGLDEDTRAADAHHDLIPTIGWNGDVVLVSPELLGVRDPHYDDFVAGNVLHDPLPTILQRAASLRYVQEFAVGLKRCKQSCGFFAYCQGAHAGDRYFEHGSFDATETEHCKTSIQAPILALIDLVNEGRET